MLLQLQQQQQWQGGAQFQTYESFSQILYDVPHGPVYVSIIIASLPFILYFFWKKSYFRTFVISPPVTIFSRIWYGWKEWMLERRVNEEYAEIAGKKIKLRDIFRYSISAGMVVTGFLILKKAFFFSLVISQSMMPTLMEADLVLVESMTTENIEVGDIIVFTPPNRVSNPVVHRVTSVSEDGRIKTKGDNSGPDDWTLTGENIEGKVVTFGGKPVVMKNIGTYFTSRKIYLLGSDPVYEGIRDSIQWVHNNGPVILLILTLLILLGSFESKKKSKAIYE